MSFCNYIQDCIIRLESPRISITQNFSGCVFLFTFNAYQIRPHTIFV